MADAAESPRLCSKFPFTVGVAVGNRGADFPGLVKHFNGLTPENCMKMSHLQPTEGCFRWSEADALVEYAAEHGMVVHGHTLLWATDERTPAWVFRDGDKPASRPLVLSRLKTHIQTVVGRYREKVASWDVVNEALGDTDPFLRQSGWTELVGPDFIAQAFQWAHEADPAAQLYYNDYGIEAPKKREKLMRLLRDLASAGAPVHAVGVQCHFELEDRPHGVGHLDELLAALHALGLKAAVSELEVGLVSRALWYKSGGKHREALMSTNPLALGAPAEALESQAALYADVFRLCRRSSCVTRVTLWGLHDGQSWLNSWPWKRTEHPLIFDRSGMPKPAFSALMAVGNSLDCLGSVVQ